MKGADRRIENMKKAQNTGTDDFETDIVRREERKKAHIEELKKTEVQKSNKDEFDELEDKKPQTDKVLTIMVAGLIIIVIGFLIFSKISSKTNTIMTLDEMHQENLKGNLNPEQGYMYNGYSFVNFSGVWYTQLQKNETTFDLTFNYDPERVKDIPVEGQLTEEFINSDTIYITFDPTAGNKKYIAVANFGLSRSLAWAFGYNMTARCTKNETIACQTAGVVTCGDTGKSVIYFKEASPTKVILNQNCVIVQGEGEEIVRAKDRLLLRWYNIIDPKLTIE